jgi:hypothetical protein
MEHKLKIVGKDHVPSALAQFAVALLAGLLYGLVQLVAKPVSFLVSLMDDGSFPDLPWLQLLCMFTGFWAGYQHFTKSSCWNHFTQQIILHDLAGVPGAYLGFLLTTLVVSGGNCKLAAINAAVFTVASMLPVGIVVSIANYLWKHRVERGE